MCEIWFGCQEELPEERSYRCQCNAEEGMYPYDFRAAPEYGRSAVCLWIQCTRNGEMLFLNKSIYDTDYPGIFSGLQWILTGDTNWDGVMRGRKLESLMRKLT